MREPTAGLTGLDPSSTGQSPGPIGTARTRRADVEATLLDAATAVLTDEGPQALTMERLATDVGVPETTIATCFPDPSAVLQALYRREIQHLGARVLQARNAHTDPRERLSAALGTFFDLISERRALFMALAAADATAGSSLGRRKGVEFVANLLVDSSRQPGRRARLVAAVFLGALRGATEAWGRGDATRAEAEAAVLAVATSLTGIDPTSQG